MTVGVLLNFMATTWLLAMLPGVGQALMLRQMLADGPRIAVATILGTVTGLGIWSAAAGAGLSAALLADPAIYHGLLLAGGGVLIVIGLRTAWSAVCRPAVGLPRIPPAPTRQQTEQADRTASRGLDRGLPRQQRAFWVATCTLTSHADPGHTRGRLRSSAVPEERTTLRSVLRLCPIGRGSRHPAPVGSITARKVANGRCAYPCA